MSDRILKTDPRLADDFPTFGLYGCNTRSTLGLVESFVGAPLSIDQLREALTRVRDQGLVTDAWSMNQERSFRESAAIAARIFSRPGIKCEQTGRVYVDEKGLNRIAFWGGWGTWTASILHFNSQSDDGHFIEGDRWLRIVWDNDPTVRITTVREILLYRLWEEAA